MQRIKRADRNPCRRWILRPRASDAAKASRAGLLRPTSRMINVARAVGNRTATASIRREPTEVFRPDAVPHVCPDLDEILLRCHAQVAPAVS